jgi:hypothetical protein
MKPNPKTVFALIIIPAIISCNEVTPSGNPPTHGYAKGSFGYDLNFIRKEDSTAAVLKTGDAEIIISPKYQAKVFTSTAEGDNGKSFGWINYKAFESPLDPHMNAYGGENRLWLGPEGNKYSLFFAKGKQQEFSNWKTPAAFDTEPWELDAKSDTDVQLSKKMELENYTGTHFSLTVKRSIALLGTASIHRLLFKLQMDPSIKTVAYKTENLIMNTGTAAWTEDSGAPCIWMLDMFPPSDQTTIVIPYNKAIAKPATTDYFGEIPSDRIAIADGHIFLKADGKQRGKLGVNAAAAEGVAGSYDAANNVLTIILFDINHDSKNKWLNQEWNSQKPPYGGDAANAYNDGPLADGKQMGPFYELESVSPAAFLKPGESLTHKHIVLHFIGEEKGLDKIAQSLLGISIQQIKTAIK